MSNSESVIIRETVKNVEKEKGGIQLNMGIDKRLCIKVTEAAEMLGISRNFAYELIEQGQLPVIRFVKRLLILRLALDRMLEEGVTQCKG